MTSPATPTLPADLEAGLKRLKLAAIRHAAPEILLTAKTQRWKPEETLRVLIDLEIASRWHRGSTVGFCRKQLAQVDTSHNIRSMLRGVDSR